MWPPCFGKLLETLRNSITFMSLLQAIVKTSSRARKHDETDCEHEQGAQSKLHERGGKGRLTFQQNSAQNQQQRRHRIKNIEVGGAGWDVLKIVHDRHQPEKYGVGRLHQVASVPDVKRSVAQ